MTRQPSSVHLQRIDRSYLHAAATDGQLYAIVDGCAVPGLVAMARDRGPARATCLYLGHAEKNYSSEAPYLFSIDEAMLADLEQQFGTGPWGCLLTATIGWEALRRHLRSLLSVSSPEGDSWLFRFWDPRVLPAFLRASTPEELNAFFGPVAAFAIPGANKEAFAAWRDPAIVDPSPRRPIGDRLPISRAQVAALRRISIADRLAATFGAGAAQPSTEADAVLVRTASGGTMRFGLGNDGLVGGVTSALGRHWALASRDDGKLARLVTPSGSALAIGYDAEGRIAEVSRDGQRRFAADHDAFGRLRRIDFPDGTAAHTDYYLQGAAALADPEGDLVAARRDRLGRVERFAYDDADRLVAAEDGGGGITAFEYDTGAHPDATRFPDGGREEYLYDPAGHLARLVRAGGRALDVACDPAGRPLRVVADDDVSTFAYDEAGRLVTAANGEIALAWRYDEAGHLVEERQGEAVIRHHYDETGHVGTSWPTGETVRWSHDADGRLAELVDWDGGRYRLAYADADAGWRMTGPDGVVTTTWQNVVGLTAATRVEVPGQAGWETTFTWDAEDRLCGRQDSRLGATAFGYDAEGQLRHATGRSGLDQRYEYDAAGNRTGSPQGAARVEGGRLLTQGATTFRYDANGATVGREGPEGHWTFAYNGSDRLVRAEDGYGRRLTFGYDPLGRRVWKRETSAAGETLTRFVWAGEQVVREVTRRIAPGAPAGAEVVRDYLFWPGGWTPLLLRDAGTVFRYHTDPLGVPVRLTASGGRIAWEAEYDPWGEARVLVGEVAQPLRLPGHWADDAFGLALHYNRFRYYDPSTGRYLSRDPIGVAGGLNLYLYAGNDPVNRADPLGLWWKTPLAILAGAAAAVAVVVFAPVILPAIGIAAGTALAAGITTVAAGAAAGAVGFALNEGLNQETFCGSCIAMAALKGAGVGALASIPFLFLPAGAGLGLVAGAGAVSGFGSYAADFAMTPGATWDWQAATISTTLGTVMGPLGKVVGSRIPVRRPYARMQDPASVGSGKEFTPAQKQAIYAENARRNGGVIRSDETGEVLVRPSKSVRGVTPPANEAQIDHINPRSPANQNATPGSNSYGNARVLSREANRAKSNAPARNNAVVPPAPLPPDDD